MELAPHYGLEGKIGLERDTALSLPEFPEANHPIVRSRLESTDQELVEGFHHHPDQGQYFTAIFCRYGVLSYTVLRNMAKSQLQIDYLYARLWRNIFYELRNFGNSPRENGEEAVSLQAFILDQTGLAIHEEELPQIETIQYSMRTASPPLWCYLQQALEQLPALLRFILVVSQTHHWQNERIAAFLQSEGEAIEATEIPPKLQEAQCLLLEALPTDIREIYLEGPLDLAPVPPQPSTDQPILPGLTGFDQPMPLRTQPRSH